MADAAPKVTVLMAAYNAVAHIAPAVASVLADPYRSLELLVVDDGSDDGTADVLAGIRDPRLRVLRLPRNAGQVVALNHGLRAAGGEFVARLDADDLWLAGRLERQLPILLADSRVTVVGGWMRRVDEHGNYLRTDGRVVESFPALVAALLAGRAPIYHISTTFRRSRVLDLGGYDEAFPYTEDTDLWRRLVLAGDEIRVVPAEVVGYRVHSGQKSWANRERMLCENIASYERFVLAIDDSVPASTLRSALWGETWLWREIRTRDDAAALAAAVDAVAARLAERLRLRPKEAEDLRQRVRRDVAAHARRAWRDEGVAYSSLRPLIGLDSRRRRMMSHMVLAVIAPLLRPVAAAKRRALRLRRALDARR